MPGEELSNEMFEAIRADDTVTTAALLKQHGADAMRVLNAPVKWTPPLLARAGGIETARLLIERGAVVERVSEWWTPGFGVIPNVDAGVGVYLVEAGAVLTPHAAAGLGHIEALRQMLETDAEVVHAKGGDGCTPLHFARTIETAALLLDHGADIDARDDDHDSTPAQWLIGDAPEVAADLVRRGATCDIFLAAALGDRARVEQLVNEDPARLRLRVGRDPVCPPLGHRGKGGTIYQWTLGFNSYPHQYALKRGHESVFGWMFDRSDTATKFLVACVTARRDEAERIAAAHPGIIASLPPDDLELLARYCWETNVDIEVVRLMLDLGWPIEARETGHAFTPLHNAAWGGYADLVDLLIERGADVTRRDPDHDSTALGFAVHCCCVDGRHPEGEYTRVVSSLIEAGCPWDPSIYPTGNARIDDGLRRYLNDDRRS